LARQQELLENEIQAVPKMKKAELRINFAKATGIIVGQ
jgi:hypothetical protein